MQHTVLPALADPLFQLQIAPDAAFPHSAWRQARAAVLEALNGGDTAVLVGPPGSGKSLLLKELARTLRQAGKPARLIERTNAVDGPPGSGILLVDEADTLGADALAALCAGPAPVVFAALPGFPKRLAGHPRLAREVMLDCLRPQDVARYVAARLDAVGRPRDLIEPEAVLALAQCSGGLLRLVNTLGGAALFLATLDGSAQVSPRHVEEAASMRDDFGENAPPSLEAEPTPVTLPPTAPIPVAPPPAALVLADPLPALPTPAPAAPAPLPLPNYRAEVMRRRTALGAMVAASGILFALPWLTRGKLTAQADDGDAAPAGVGNPPLAVADSGAAQPVVPDAPAALAGSPSLKSPQPPAAPLPASHAEPVRRADKTSPAPLVGERRVGMASGIPVLFQGPIYNETMGQGGHVALVVRKQEPSGAITARFDASQGLLGSGVLAGNVSETGRLTASGQLMVGKNPFYCDLTGTIVGDKLTGSASFVRNGGSGWTARSVFTLTRA